MKFLVLWKKMRRNRAGFVKELAHKHKTPIINNDGYHRSPVFQTISSMRLHEPGATVQEK
jgi:hypothetical protein